MHVNQRLEIYSIFKGKFKMQDVKQMHKRQNKQINMHCRKISRTMNGVNTDLILKEDKTHKFQDLQMFQSKISRGSYHLIWNSTHAV